MDRETIKECLQTELAKENLKEYQRTKINAVLLHLSGKTKSEIADQLGVNLRTVQRYIGNYNTHTLEDFLEQRKPGNVNKLPADIHAKIKEDIVQGPSSGGYVVEKWTAALLVKHIKKKYGIRINEESCRILLNKNLPGRLTRKTTAAFLKQINEAKQKGDVWIVESFVLCNYETGKNKQGFRPSKPGDEIFTEEQLKEKGIDPNLKPRQKIIIIAINLTTNQTAHDIYSDNKNVEEVWKEFLKSLIKKSVSNHIVIALKQHPLHKKIAQKLVHRKESKRTIKILMRPKRDYISELTEIKKQLVEKFEIRDNLGLLRFQDERKITAISRYLDAKGNNP